MFVGGLDQKEIVENFGILLLKLAVCFMGVWAIAGVIKGIGKERLSWFFRKAKLVYKSLPKGSVWKIVMAIVVIVFYLGVRDAFNQTNDRIDKLRENISSLSTRINRVESSLGTNRLLCSENNTISQVRNVTVRIIGGESEGSGVAIDPHLIVTNYHVIQYELAPKVVFSDNTFEMGKIVMADKDADIALLRVEKDLIPISTKSLAELEVGEELLSIGYPFGGDLQGEATVKKGILSGRRRDGVKNVDYVQIDATMNPGMSGGPMVDLCGKMVGMNTSGTAGLGLAISTDTIRQRWTENGEKETQDLKDVATIKFEPDKGPKEVVQAYYSYLKLRNLEKAYALLSDNYPKGNGFEEYKQGFATSMDTTIIYIEPDETNENIMKVKLSSTDLIGDAIIYKFFEGTVEARKIDDHWKLWSAKVKEVVDPPMDWYWE